MIELWEPVKGFEREYEVSNAKFTNEQVKKIRKEYEPNIRGKGMKTLAKKYGVSCSTIKNILYRRKWKYVD